MSLLPCYCCFCCWLHFHCCCCCCLLASLLLWKTNEKGNHPTHSAFLVVARSPRIAEKWGGYTTCTHTYMFILLCLRVRFIEDAAAAKINKFGMSKSLFSANAGCCSCALLWPLSVHRVFYALRLREVLFGCCSCFPAPTASLSLSAVFVCLWKKGFCQPVSQSARQPACRKVALNSITKS